MIAAPAAFSQNLAANDEGAFQKTSEDCILATKAKLVKLGLTPSEEDSDYDMKYDDLFRECMASKGMPVQGDGEEIPLTGDEALPLSEVKE